MQIVIVLLGIVLIVVVLLDALETVVLPRRAMNPLRITALFYRLTWYPWAAFGRRIHSERQRENYLAVFGPLSVIMLLGVWAVGLVIGFALLRSVAEDGQSGTFWHYLYVSATTFFTLGVGDPPPATVLARIVTIVQGATGFSFLGIVIGYLPTFYQGFSRRETDISLLDARAGSPPTAVELIRRYCQNGQPVNLEQFFANWERWSAELLESHLSYPMLCLFRSQHENESWVAALTMVLDASALVIASFDGPIAHSANLTFAMARHAAVDLTQVASRIAPYTSKDDRLLAAALVQLREIFGDKATLSEAKLTELRALYEPYVNSLSTAFVMTLPPWTAKQSVPDNWQTTAWSRIDGINGGEQVLVGKPTLHSHVKSREG